MGRKSAEFRKLPTLWNFNFLSWMKMFSFQHSYSGGINSYLLKATSLLCLCHSFRTGQRCWTTSSRRMERIQMCICGGCPVDHITHPSCRVGYKEDTEYLPVYTLAWHARSIWLKGIQLKKSMTARLLFKQHTLCFWSFASGWSFQQWECCTLSYALIASLRFQVSM